MEPRIRYLRTRDGVTLAYYEMGEGTPAVWMDIPYSHLLVEWQQDVAGDGAYRAVASQARLVRYDHRGFGLSDRAVEHMSLDALVSDLEAVVERLGLPPFILLATRGPTTPIAVAYAARHPEAITDMVLFNATPGIPAPVLKRMRDLLEAADGDWRFASEGISRLVLGWDDEQASRQHAELLRASVDLDGFRRWLDAYASWDIDELLPKVRTRTLLTNTQDDPWFGEERGRAMASMMPDASCFISTGRTVRERLVETALAVASFLGRRSTGLPERTMAESNGSAGSTNGTHHAAPNGTSFAAYETADLGAPLTERETEVLRLLATGLSNRAMAERLVVSVRTVETHVAHIYSKLGVSSRAQATALAISRGLAEPLLTAQPAYR